MVGAPRVLLHVLRGLPVRPLAVLLVLLVYPWLARLGTGELLAVAAAVVGRPWVHRAAVVAALGGHSDSLCVALHGALA